MCALCSLAGIAPGGVNCIDVSDGSGDGSVTTTSSSADLLLAAPSFALAQIIQQLRTSWGGSLEGTTMSWSGSGPINYYIGGTPYPSGSTEVWTSMTALMISRATLAFELWDDLIARDLNPVSTAASGQIQFEYASTTSGGGTYSRPSLGSSNGFNSYGTANRPITRDEIWLNSTWTSHDTDSDMYYGGYGFQTYMHEIGHSLGLSHPGSYNAGTGTITYANSAEYAQDNRQYTIMSYFGGYDLNIRGWQQDGTFNSWLYSSTPMLHDVAAIQAIYGADMTTRVGDTTYGFHSNAGRDVFDFNIDINPILTVWDAGGNDTLDLSGYSVPQLVDLHAGAYSDIGGLRGNLAIAYNVTIENAIGGFADDTISGNDANNTITGGLGNDTIDAGAGIDTAVFGGLSTSYTFTDLGGGSVRVSGPDGTDTLMNVEFLRFADQTLPWPLVPDLVAGISLTGSRAAASVRNMGGAAPATTAGVYLSTDGTITTADTPLTTFAVPALSFGATFTNTISLSFPGNLTPGVYYVGTIADVTGAVSEGNESNNASGGFTVLLGNDSANTLNGTTAFDTILGLGGSDRINGGGFVDSLAGGLGADIFVFDGTALADASGAISLFDGITDYDQSSGAYNAAEGDQIDLSAILSTAYNRGNGQPASSLVRVVAGPIDTRIQIDLDGAANGTNWISIARLDGIRVGDTVNVILDATLPGGTNLVVAPATATPSDYDADSKSDIFWHTNGGLLAVWEMNGTQIKAADYVRMGSTVVGTPGPDWHVVDTGILPSDFDGDGKGDVLWATDSGILAIWEMNGTQIKNADYIKMGSTTIKVPGPDWHAFMAGDFDADGKSDILWTTDSGILAIWEMDGTQIKNADYIKLGSTTIKAPGPDWHVLGLDDFDGDGKGDLLWRTDAGLLAIWEMDGTHVKTADYFRMGSGIVGTPGPDWHVAGTGDFDGDGKGELLWRTDSGILAIWEMNGTQITSADYIRMGSAIIKPPGNDWHIHGTGDYDGDGRDDILWRTDSGALAIWKMNGFQITGADYLKLGSAMVGAPGADWNIATHHYDLI